MAESQRWPQSVRKTAQWREKAATRAVTAVSRRGLELERCTDTMQGLDKEKH